MIAILGILALFIIVIAYLKRKDLKYYLLVYTLSTIGTLIDTGTEIMDSGGIGNFLTDIFYLLGAFILFVVIFKEYYDIFLRNNFSATQLRSIGIFSIFFSLSIIIYTIEVIMTIFFSTFVVMLLQIYLKKKKITHAFISLSIVPVLFAGVFNLFEHAGYDYFGVYSVGMNIIFHTIVFATAIVALLDQKLMVAQSEKFYMKDKYSHDLGNIFHAISMAYELITISDSLQDEMDIIIRKKINEASELVKYIRNL